MPQGYTLEQLKSMGAVPAAPPSAQTQKGLTLQELQAKGAKPSAPNQIQPVAPTANDGGYKPLLQAKEGEGMLSAGTKALVNTPGSALNFAKGVAQSFNPITIAKNIGEFGSGVAEFAKEKGGILPALGSVAKELPGAAYKTLVPQAAQQLIKGDTIGAQKTLTEDPFGQVAPVVLAAEGGAKALGKEPLFKAAVEKTANVATAPLQGLKKAVGTTAEYGMSQATGLAPDTIRTITNDPKAFAAADVGGDTRLTTASKVKAGLDAAIDDLGETGKNYQVIREAKRPVVLPSTLVTDTLSKYGISIGQDGKLVTSSESVPLSPGDISAVQHFVEQYGPDKVKTSNAFLNARKALDNLSEWDATKTDVPARIAKDLRKEYDAQGKRQIQGLALTDAQYGPMARELKQLRKDYLNPDGSLKDGAINKIANLVGKGKEPILQRLETMSPGITADIKIIKALEDVRAAQGQKVGTYQRALGVGGGYVAGGPIGAIIGSILTSPKVAVYLLETYGKVSGVGDLVLKRIKTKFVSGEKLNAFENRAFLTILGVAADQQRHQDAQKAP